MISSSGPKPLPSDRIGLVWHIDLSQRLSQRREIPAAWRVAFLGGRGFGAAFYAELIGPEISALAPENCLIIATGPLTGSYVPLSSPLSISGKSPLNGSLVTGLGHGQLGQKLKACGVDALIITGVADRPTLLDINNEAVAFVDASRLWGLGTMATEAALPPEAARIVIGPAGENRVPLATLVSEGHIIPAAGLGAVMGAKNLKAIVITGNKGPKLADKEALAKVRQKMTRFLLAHPLTGRFLPHLGDSFLIGCAAAKQLLPTLNFQQRSHRDALKLSGEAWREKQPTQSLSCAGCPLSCRRLIGLAGKQVAAPGYESAVFLGSLLGNFSFEHLRRWQERAIDWGLDIANLGASLALAMEMQQRGLFATELVFTRLDNIEAILADIALGRGLGRELGLGIDQLAQTHKAEELAMQVKGLAPVGIDPRGAIGHALDLATGHHPGLFAPGSVGFLETHPASGIDPLSPARKVDLVIFQQNFLATLTALLICPHIIFALLPAALLRRKPHGLTRRINQKLFETLPAGHSRLLSWLEGDIRQFLVESFQLVSGTPLSFAAMLQAGARIFNLERHIFLRDGLKNTADTLPLRWQEGLGQPRLPDGEKPPAPIQFDRLLASYYRQRGWDKHGRPRKNGDLP